MIKENILNKDDLFLKNEPEKYTDEEIKNKVKSEEGLNNEFVLYLINKDKVMCLLNNFSKFKNLSLEIANKLIEIGKGHSVAFNLEKFEGLNYLEIANKLIEFGKGAYVVFNLEKFEGLNHLEIANKLIEVGEGYSVAQYLKKFEGLNHLEIANKLIEAGLGGSVAQCLEKFEGLDRDLGKKLLNSLQDIYFMEKVNNYFKPELDKMVSKTLEIFGSFSSRDCYIKISKINDNDPETIKELKLKKGGNDGLRELQERFYNFKKEIISEDFNSDVLLEKDKELYKSYFKSYIRFEEAEWGNSDDKSLENIINYFSKYKKNDEIKPLNPNFKPSSELDILRSNEEAREKYKFNEHFLVRFSVLVNSIKEAKNLYKEKFPISKLVEEVEEKRLKLIQELKEKSDKMPNPLAKEAINKKIESLEIIKLRSLQDFQENFTTLAKNNNFNELLRQSVFLIAFAKNRDNLDFDLDKIDSNKPRIDDISWVLNFVDHITNQETMSKYFTDNQASKMFNEIISAKAISEEISSLQKEGGSAKSATKIQLIPTRGLLVEFSGHIADACWASRYDSILKSFPNFTTVVIRQNPETKFERLAGAFMLIETESKEGEPLLVIRGLNPIENMINSVLVDDFYNKVAEYVKNLAAKDNRKAAIVIDDHPGGSASNRGVLYSYLNKLSQGLKQIDLNSDNDTEFNGYSIKRQTYLI